MMKATLEKGKPSLETLNSRVKRWPQDIEQLSWGTRGKLEHTTQVEIPGGFERTYEGQ
jgi:hypothetical protein